MKSIVVYYSRKGENYVNGSIVNLKEGNTAIAAGMISNLTSSDIFEIDTVKEYPSAYYDCIAEAKYELHSDARPELKAIPDLSGYDTIILGYPNWWGTMPMAVFTFLEKAGLAGKTIHPFCTNEGSGLGSSYQDIIRLCPDSMISEGLSIHGAEVNKSFTIIHSWLSALDTI